MTGEPVRILMGDVIDGLKRLSDGSVHCCVTSPPYWGLRDYGVDGQIGLEPTPEAFIEKMVAVFREVRRVLREDGTLWLNLGDSYFGGGRGGNPDESEHRIGDSFYRGNGRSLALGEFGNDIGQLRLRLGELGNHLGESALLDDHVLQRRRDGTGQAAGTAREVCHGAAEFGDLLHHCVGRQLTACATGHRADLLQRIGGDLHRLLLRPREQGHGRRSRRVEVIGLGVVGHERRVPGQDASTALGRRPTRRKLENPHSTVDNAHFRDWSG